MPTDLREVKLLRNAIYALIFILTTITGWNAVTITTLPNEYVRLERYKSDHQMNQETLKRIENKIDRLIK